MTSPFAVVFAVLATALAAPAPLRAQQDPAPAPQAASPEAPARDLAARIDTMCAPAIAAEIALGFVVGAIDGEATIVRSYGRLARDGDARADGSTLFEIGSVSKVFTGLLLADAVERGLVSLDDTVQQHLPAGTTLHAFEDQPILLWHLATHSSGLPRLAGMTGSDPQDPYAHVDERALLAAVDEVRPSRAPGARYEYSNFAMGLLGYLLQRANGCATYDEMLAQRITKPLGMRDTAVVLDATLRARLAPPHDEAGAPNHTWDLAMLAGAGGIRSTVDDMLRFARLQLDPGDSLLAAAVRLAQQKRHDGQNGVAVALAWHRARDGMTLVHLGQTGGYHSYLGVTPKTRKAVVLLANTAASDLDQVGERILQLLHGMPVKPPEFVVPVQVARADLQRLVGRYRMAPAVHLDVALREDGLYAQLTGQDAFRVFAKSPTEFFYRIVEATITFEFDGDTVTGLVLHQNGRDMRCRRTADAPGEGK